MATTRTLQTSKVEEALAHWDTGRLVSSTSPATGKINTTLVVTCEKGQFVLRRHSRRNKHRTERQHAVVAYAAEKGAPAVPAIPLARGDTVLDLDGADYSLYSFVEGYQVDRGQTLNEYHIREMGRSLAELQQVIVDYPTGRIIYKQDRPNSEDALRRIDDLVRIVTEKEPDAWETPIVLERMAARRRWIENGPEDLADELAALPIQAIHGDYNETNLIFRSTARDHGDIGDVDVVAIIDWDSVGSAHRLWEIVRTLALVFTFDVEEGAALIRGYANVWPFDLDELDLVVRAFNHIRGHSIWMYEAIYLEGNDSIREYLKPGGFTPYVEQWAPLRDHLNRFQITS